MASNSDTASVEEQLPTIVSLNVGGALFTTRLETLRASRGSMLFTMFSGNYHVDKDSEGRYFIDREGKHFSYILNYLRDPIKFTISVNNIPPVLVEAEYYQISPLVDLLRGHPSLIGTKILNRYREDLGVTYTKLKQSVIVSISKKRHILATPISSASKIPDQTPSHFDDPLAGESQGSSDCSQTPPTPVQTLQGTLQTDVRIATPTVIFENSIDSQNTLTNTFQPSLRRVHQLPYNACLADGHDFKAIDIISNYWQKSEVWDLLLHDLKSEININIKMKIENNTVYCNKCRYHNLYGTCIISIYWLKMGHVPHCSTQESTQYLSSQETNTYS